VSLKNAGITLQLYTDAETGIKMTKSTLWMMTMMMMLMTVVEVTVGNSQLVWHAGDIISHFLPQLDMVHLGQCTNVACACTVYRRGNYLLVLLLLSGRFSFFSLHRSDILSRWRWNSKFDKDKFALLYEVSSW